MDATFLRQLRSRDVAELHDGSRDPTPEACRAVAKRLRTAAEEHQVEIGMHVAVVLKGECGTLCCHAGLYLLARVSEANLLKWGDPLDDPEEGRYKDLQTLRETQEVMAYFQDGADLMAWDLGFLSSQHLKDWACRRYDLWGNDDGAYMFSEWGAFGSDVNEIDVTRIANWWDGVADRIEYAQDLRGAVFYARSGDWHATLRARTVEDAIEEVRLGKNQVAVAREEAAADPDAQYDPQTWNIYRVADDEEVACMVDVEA